MQLYEQSSTGVGPNEQGEEKNTVSRGDGKAEEVLGEGEASEVAEEWRQVAGYEGIYMVSNTGKVRSIGRIVVRGNGMPLKVKDRIMKQSTDGGYKVVGLTKLGITKVVYVHLIMAMAFLIKPQTKRPEVDHINRVKGDNRLVNLRWVSKTVNSMNSGESIANTSGRRGVYFDKSRKLWKAYIKINKITKYLGGSKVFNNAVKLREKAEEIFWRSVQA